ncbi:hypothetical protein HH195_02045 [Sarcina sp. JB2]|uniref:Uncharacterized protein n=1 Tax=Candidatus Sarcina troglodytae TaxID=2726954 RepID=A0ACD1BBA2_9CLOT|nr:BsaA family SipW-dependent biofilm matrix protein [Sarcina sp. JB2]QPJ84757.1 hypothetical protein HH195_02045 [Sarcina sp. JB2]
MNKKKLSALLLAGTLTAGVVGGTFAWFTSQDTVTNKFATGGTNDDDSNAGIDIWEKFEEPTNVVPGTTTDKLVQVKNTSTYDQFIRVKITPKWEDGKLNKKEETGERELDYLKLNFVKSNLGDRQGQWFKDGDYYYYIGKVSGGTFTNTLLESVTLSTEAGNKYKNQKYQVEVKADSIQADNGAYKEWENVSDKVKKALAECVKLDAIGNENNAGTAATPVKANGGNTEGGNTEGGNTEGGNTEGGNTEGGNTENGAGGGSGINQ